MESGKRVEVIVWDDAHADTGVTSFKKAAKTGPIVTVTVGFFLAENKHGVTLGTDLYPDYAKEAYGPIFIPHGCIKRRVVLDLDWDTVTAASEPLLPQPSRRQDSKMR